MTGAPLSGSGSREPSPAVSAVPASIPSADDGIREVHGGTRMAGTSKTDPLLVFEKDKTILLKRGYHEISLTPRGARFLARKLYRLALRIEKRSASAIEAGTAETGTGSVHESAGPQGDAPGTSS